jgi:hypothetical protein
MSHRVLVSVSGAAVLIAFVLLGLRLGLPKPRRLGLRGGNRTCKVFGTSAPSHPWNGPRIWQTESS